MKRDITKFRGFENVIQEKPIFNPPVSSFTKEDDELMSVVFAPDPVTGLPSSDIAFMMKHKDKPEVLQYIQQRLQVVHEHIAGVDNPDDALSAIRNYKEDLVSYSERLRDNFSPVESNFEEQNDE